jgi:hypothetical protein
MKNISTGTGIALLAGAIVAYPIIDRVMPRAEAGATHVAAVVAAATVQNPPEPTIVWYGMAHSPLNYNNGDTTYGYTIFARAWSDGKVEMKKVCSGNSCSDQITDLAVWFVVNNPAQGLTYRSDINFDSNVDGSDLAQVLNDWGNAPRQDIVPSTCPLNLINP